MVLKQTIIQNNEHFKDSIIATIKNKRKEIYSYLNTYSLYLLNKHPKFKETLENADYIRIGGIGTKIYCKLSQNINVDKVTFNHFFLNFGGKNFLIKKNFSIYCLGGTDSVIVDVAKIFVDEKINIVGYRNGFFTKNESEDIISELNIIQPQIILVGLGTPFSDFWTFQYKDKLPNCAIIHVGNFFDLVTNNVVIAPKFLYNSGFEWIFRLIQEPKRLFKRYLLANTYLLKKIIVFYFNKNNS